MHKELTGEVYTGHDITFCSLGHNFGIKDSTNRGEGQVMEGEGERRELTAAQTEGPQCQENLLESI